MATTAVPEHYRNAVIAHVMVDGAAKAIDFYTKAFGAEEMFHLGGPGERILHAEISIHGSTIMLGDAEGPTFAAPTTLGGTTVGLHVFVDDVDVLAEQRGRRGTSAATDRPVSRRPHSYPAGSLRTRLGLPHAR
ncbi:VOC family protein [Streptomyces sp. 6-11-2]|uniref:VOC family protein n=1 Tax=Streptomyces sp. 6-11-2 TaxID=2585753 RepID=UPI0011702106|nr:VOC family protein [Streptomyces sp. 6-11-2]GED84733.1 hypothetical protein TNCT6_18180 [Streptomyces sp. 6-11-2]